ncbi:MAG: Mur ligase family protein [Candidatus Poseidoniaceae archaeon]|jgi:dihydrofolate synthase/folylpolyglutamate synthase|nr:Mur ligase family protein [Candidatus Poseidoniaceae archaeon]
MPNAKQWLDLTRQNGMSLGLTNTHAMIQRLNLDFSSMKIIHVAGSNGKGTTCSLMAASLTLSGVSNLMFTSPHVSRIEERFRINSVPISNELFNSILEEIYEAARSKAGQESIELTFFETTFLIATVCAIKSNVEFMIVETGLGGRLDATRCIPADACLLTSISCEHTDILGDTLGEITAEKAAIARPNKPIIIRDMGDESFRKAVMLQCNNAGNESIDEIKDSAIPHFVTIPEKCNIKDEAEILVKKLFEIMDLSVQHLEEAKNKVRWPARMQLIETKSNLFLLDAAHNPSGLLRVLPELIEKINTLSPMVDGKQTWTLIFGTSPQKKLEEMLEYVSQLCNQMPPTRICLTKPLGGRYPGTETHLLAQYEWPIENIQQFESAEKVLESLSQNNPSSNGLIVSLGSLYLQGNILKHLGLDDNEELSILPKQS